MFFIYEIENMCRVSIELNRNTSESLGEREMLWEQEPQASVSTAFRVLPNFHECFYNSLGTRRTCFLFLLENIATKKKKNSMFTSTLRAESPSIFLDKSGRGRRLCERLQDSLIRRSSEKMDESVQFSVGETGFY